MEKGKSILRLAALIGMVSFLLLVSKIGEAQTSTDWFKDIGYGAKPIGSATYSTGLAITKVISKNTKGINAHVVSYNSEVGFPKGLSIGEIQMCTMTSMLSYYSNLGMDMFAKGPKISLRTLCGGEVYYFPLMVRIGSGIETFPDVKGKRCMFDHAGSLVSVKNFQSRLKAYGLSEQDIIQQTWGSVAEITGAFREKRTDAAMEPIGLGSPFVQELALTGDLKLVSDTDEALRKVNESYPFLSPKKLPVQGYKGHNEPIKCPGLRMFFVVNKGISNDQVYSMTKAIFDNFDELVNAYKPMTMFALPDSINPTDLVVPVHPGAIKYYKERGLWKDAHETMNKKLLAEEAAKVK